MSCYRASSRDIGDPCGRALLALRWTLTGEREQLRRAAEGDCPLEHAFLVGYSPVLRVAECRVLVYLQHQKCHKIKHRPEGLGNPAMSNGNGPGCRATDGTQ